MDENQLRQSEESAQDEVWRRAFQMFDKDNDGTISLHELGSVLRSLNYNPTQKHVSEAAKRLDRDGNGKCDFEDFRSFMKETKQSLPHKEDFQDVMLRAFKTFDRDGNKFIDRKEIQGVLTSLGECLSEAELDYMMKYADLNGDGKIDYEEFVNLCLQPCL
ncbi:neo-calmodulin-like [Haliotis rubra]|uniref:neo-calmodulin-like n=1 Tax=Haliotis rubra TaxID=36100 RepID=UPI001EE5CCF1|nr:neo-calmodulin-like [Haliotis rubra]